MNAAKATRQLPAKPLSAVCLVAFYLETTMLNGNIMKTENPALVIF